MGMTADATSQTTQPATTRNAETRKLAQTMNGVLLKLMAIQNLEAAEATKTKN